MTALKIVFWICVFIVFYTYIGYGLLLALLVQVKRLVCGKQAPVQLPADEVLPHVTLLICAYNEQDIVDMKMQNTQQLDYPKDKLHVVWVTDGSTDETNERLKRHPDIEIIFAPERRGKTAALNHGIGLVKTDITVMTDANTLLNPDAIKEIVRYFMDPRVACVAGEKRVIARNDAHTAAKGEGLYWRYESTLKQMDSELYSTMGAAGELNAIRTSLYKPMPESALLDDFVMSMRMVDHGYRIAYCKDAYAMEYGSANMEEESKRKRRIAAGGLQSIWWLKDMMLPFPMSKTKGKNGWWTHFVVAFQFVSHRVLRWTITPFALLMLIPLNIALVLMNAGTMYNIFAILQILFYLTALCGWMMYRKGHTNKIVYIPYYFLFMNMNVFSGIRYLMGHKTNGAWEKAMRG